jgi:RNA polymerase sigma-70 factor, ECF subfamily
VPTRDDPLNDVVRQLMERRDEDNFRRVFCRYYGPVYHFFVRKGFGTEDSKDLTQEVFVAVYNGIEGLRAETAFVAWLFSIARYVMLHHLERQKKHSVIVHPGAGREDGDSTGMDRVAESGPDPLQEVLDRERVEIMRQALAELPDREQGCLRARLVEDLNYRQIGERLGISENTVAVHVHRAMKKLRTRLKHIFGEGAFVGDLEP